MNRPKKIIEEYYFGNPVSIAEKILFIKRDTRLAEYKECLTNSSEFGNVWRGVTGTLRGEKVSIIVTGIGPSMVGDSVYALDKPGAICIYSGTCGGLDETLGIGDYVLAKQAVCADGYSLLLGYDNFDRINPDEKTFQALEAALRATGTKYARGVTFTTSSVVRESDLDFWGFVNSECKAIEMGCASFYAASLRSNKRPAAFFWVTDLPTRGKSFFEPLAQEDVQIKQERYNRAVSLDIELLSRL